MGWCWDDEMPVLTPLLYEGKDVFMGQMKGALSDVGIGYASAVRACCPADAVLLTECRRLMEEVLFPMMKESDNLF